MACEKFDLGDDVAQVDANTLVSSGRDRVLNVWDLKTNKLLRSLAMFEEIESIFALPKYANE